jgi:hypothetical protein
VVVVPQVVGHPAAVDREVVLPLVAAVVVRHRMLLREDSHWCWVQRQQVALVLGFVV